MDFQLGAPPLRAGGDFDSSYLGKITLSTEWWHPWVVNEIGSGGVQYCNYSGNGNYNKKVTARVSIRHYKTGAVGSWGLGDYQLSNTFNCPGQH